VEFRERTKKFAAATIRLFVKLPKGREEVRVLGKQLLRSGTSVAAHVREASRARSDEEFVSKLGGALQEADESLLWLKTCATGCWATHPMARCSANSPRTGAPPDHQALGFQLFSISACQLFIWFRFMSQEHPVGLTHRPRTSMF
jgi:four helix bundle protein